MLERPRRLIRILVPLAVAASALGVVACGGGDNAASSEPAQKVVNTTFTGNKKVDSGKLDLNLTANLDATGLAATQLKGPITIKAIGPFQSRGENELPKLDLQLTVGGAGQDFSAGAVSTGDKGFISYQGKDYAVPDKIYQNYKKSFAEQQKKDQNKNSLDITALGVDPQKWLSNPKNEGVEKVAGADTIHVSSGIDIGAFLDDVNDLLKRTDQLGLSKQQRRQLPAQLSAKSKKQIEDSVKEAKVDVYTGKDDKTLRRLDLNVSFELPAELKQQAQGVTGGNIKLRLELADLNKKQDISAPTDARPWSELQQQLGLNSLSGALGSSGSGSSSGGTTNPGSSGGGISASDRKRTERYLKCVQKAKTPEDVQACGTQLNK